MEPITQFVTTYGPDLIKPKPEFTLQRLCFRKVEPLFMELEDELKIQFLVHCASLATWLEKSRQCNPEVMNGAAQVLLGKLGITWMDKKKAFPQLLEHLFNQAIRHPDVTQEEIDALISVKRSQQFQLMAMKERSLSLVERSIHCISTIWNFTINFNIPGQARQLRLRVTPFVLATGFDLYLRYSLLPKVWKKHQPKVVNFMINHFSAKVFPIAFKTYDWCYTLSWLPYLTSMRAVHLAQDVIYEIAILDRLPLRLMLKAAYLGIPLIVNAPNMVVPALEKLENKSEMARYRREINEIKIIWIKGAQCATG